jgi:protein-tyrosine-phosphatase
MSERFVFLCPHGAAKSVIAAAYCQQLADQQHVPLQATSAGTEPDAEVTSAVVTLLRKEGIDVANQRPRRVTPEELATARHIISLGCDLGDLARPGMVIEYWDDVPSPSENLLAARDRIWAHVEQLVLSLRHSAPSMSDTAKEAVDDDNS